ncbi:MAG TPA: MBL fold metallo-hydrolase [Caldilineae bacterium]|nr:MBL fold metallo-hydrolase [Caldilineae bacterium]
MIVERLVVGPLQVNCYILGCRATGEAIVVDPGGHVGDILATLERLDLQVVKIVNTHAHFDHMLGVRELQEATRAPFLLHPADVPVLGRTQQHAQAWLGIDPGTPPAVDEFLEAGQLISFGEEALEVRLTPGHSPGSVSLVDHKGRRVFTGDTLFAGSVGRSDLPGGDARALLQSIQTQLLSLPDDYEVLPGHGPATTIGEERLHNPFLQAGAAFQWLS